MKLCRFYSSAHPFPRVGLTLDEVTLLDLSGTGVSSLTELLEVPNLSETLRRLAAGAVRRVALSEVCFASPTEAQEVWAAGVTYLRSKTARMEESDFSATAYDRVYDAPRPELFFKSQGSKVIGSGGVVGIRSDAKWNVPEPELALVFNSRANLVGYTIGNDMSSRDIEGENLLYLPQAKTYRGSCALGPFIRVATSEEEARNWSIRITIHRADATIFSGETKVGNIKRTFDDLASWLHRCQEFKQGVVLLTGTGVVPPNEFTLASGDVVRIEIEGIGVLENAVEVV